MKVKLIAALLLCFTAADAQIVADTLFCPCGARIVPLGACGDIDGDGICIQVDNCPTDANADQANLDGDARGDVCDSDADGDGVPVGQDCDDMDAMLFPGGPCDDGVANTYEDTYDAGCGCVGELDPVRDSIGSYEAAYAVLSDGEAVRVSEAVFNSIYSHDSLFSVVDRVDTIPGSKTEGTVINRAPNLGLAQFWDNPNNNTNVTASSGYKYVDIQANDQLVLFWIRSSAAVSNAKVKVGSAALDDFVDIVTVDLIFGNNWFVCKKCPPIPYSDPRLAVYYPSPSGFYVFNSSNVNAMSIQGATGNASVLSYTGVSQTTFPETEPRYYHEPSQYLVTVHRP